MTILVLDLGSSSVRTLLFDDSAHLLAQVTKPHRFTTTPPGASMLDAAELQTRVESCLDEILRQPQARDLRAVGLDTFVGNVLGVDTQGQAVTPLFTYADTRSAEDVATLAQQVDGEAVHQRTGCMIHTAYQPSRLHWLRRTNPHQFRTAAQWVDVGTYLYRQWFGDAPCSYSAASWSGMLNRAALTWDEAWLKLLKLPPTALPPLADYSAAQSGLLPKYAQRWPILRDVPFFLAVGDGAAANVGSGCVEPGQVALSLGTTAALRTASTKKLPVVPEGLWSYRISADRHLIGGATTEGGNIYQWVKDTLILPADAEQRLIDRAPDCHGLTFLPLLAGERSPGWALNASGMIDGLRLSTTPLDLLQAALEAVALRLALIAEQLGGDQAVVANGRSLEASRAWTQIIANALNRPVQLAGEKEITARGTAILALSALDKLPLDHFPLSITATIEPQAAAAASLRAARERQEALYRKLYANRGT